MLPFVAVALLSLQVQSPVTEWRLARDLRIGTLNDPETTIGDVASVLITPAREILIADRLASTILIYNWNGQLLRRLGREGSGPGEFRTLGMIGSHHDTLWAADFTQRTISFFTSAGKVARTVRVETPTRFLGTPIGVLRSGAVVCFEIVPANLIAQKQVTGQGIWLWFPGQAKVDTSVWLDKRNSYGGQQVQQGYRTVRQPFPNESLFGIDNRGSGFVALHQTESLLARNQYELVRYDSLGRRSWSKTINFTAIELTDAMVRRAGESFLGALENAKIPDATAASMRKAYEAVIFVPKSLPPATALFLAQTGEIWVRREDTRQSSVWWDLLSPTGVPLSRVQLNSDAKIVGASTEYVWLSEQDKDGSPGVSRYRLVRSPRDR